MVVVVGEFRRGDLWFKAVKLWSYVNHDLILALRNSLSQFCQNKRSSCAFLDDQHQVCWIVLRIPPKNVYFWGGSYWMQHCYLKNSHSVWCIVWGRNLEQASLQINIRCHQKNGRSSLNMPNRAGPDNNLSLMSTLRRLSGVIGVRSLYLAS